jgi:predicted  nucleic acid-binding Zn-ribbon protein
VRAYKKKKAELETLRDQYYNVETQLFTVGKQHVIMDEENVALKSRVQELEKLLKDS